MCLFDDDDPNVTSVVDAIILLFMCVFHRPGCLMFKVPVCGDSIYYCLGVV